LQSSKQDISKQLVEQARHCDGSIVSWDIIRTFLLEHWGNIGFEPGFRDALARHKNLVEKFHDIPLHIVSGNIREFRVRISSIPKQLSRDAISR
jgi:hypothetical protein